MTAAAVDIADWGTIDAKAVRLFRLDTGRGLTVQVTNYGAIITHVLTPDRRGQVADIALGFDSLDGYIAGHPYFGAIIGRCANRIARGQFILDGVTYQLACNNPPHHLHGGVKGFDKQVWDAQPMATELGPALRLRLCSPHGAENYPGYLWVTVTYTATTDNTLTVDMEAVADRPTVCNLAQHAYWNLAGHDAGVVLDHEVELRASRVTTPDATGLPVGRVDEVAGTPLDFRTSKPIGRDLAAVGGTPAGYDHNYVLDGAAGTLRDVAVVREPGSGRWLRLATDQPGCQLYTGNFLDGTVRGKGGVVYRQHHGLCLETQVHPDAIHHADWPSVVLRPGQRYGHRMVLGFGAA